MKVRWGFVANSSSSSFYIYGTKVEESEAIEIVKKIANKDLTNFGELTVFSWLGEYYKNEAPSECPLYLYSDDYTGYYLGADISLLGEDETKRQFKTKIESYFKETYGYHKDWNWFDVTYYN